MIIIKLLNSGKQNNEKNLFFFKIKEKLIVLNNNEL